MNKLSNIQFITFNSFSFDLFSSTYLEDKIDVLVYSNGSLSEEITAEKYNEQNGVYSYKGYIKKGYDTGKLFSIVVKECNGIISNLLLSGLQEFDDKYYYSKNDLGCIFSKSNTVFSVWAPLANRVSLKIEVDNEFEIYPMKLCDHGVYKISLSGNFENKKYHYIVENNGIPFESNDPYGKGVSLNSEYSVVLDLNKIISLGTVEPKKPYLGKTKSIIYETHVKDFTLDENTDIKDKGYFSGLAERNRVTSKKHPAGLEYLIKLGITHLQLLPILDYAGVDEITNDTYNWGYDVVSFFAIEGSLSSNPSEPIYRLIELKNLVNVLHANNIRINIDVVYNHIYKYETSVLEKVVPGYYFRKYEDGTLYNSSGCGNDFASEKKMASKMILDSLLYLTTMFDFDGYRFDLMGLLDSNTLNEASRMLLEIKPSIMLYGEGWNMESTLQVEHKGCSENCKNLKDYSFFNDMYRDLIKGSSFKGDITRKGYANGDLSYWHGFDFAFLGSITHHSYEPKYMDASQSLNYIECHDNFTLFDKYCFSNPEEDINTILNRISFSNDLLIYSLGIPFIHMGQEIGLSKNNLDNTYNVPLINNMRWDLVDERFEMVERISASIKNRIKIDALSYIDETKIHDSFYLYHYDNDLLVYSIKKSKNYILINPTLNNIEYSINETENLSGNIKPLSVTIL